MAKTRKTRVKTALELATSTASPVAVASHNRPGGTHGKHGTRRNRSERRGTRQALRRGDFD